MNRTRVTRCIALLALLLTAPVASAQEADSTAMDWSAVPAYRMVPGDVLSLNFGPNPSPPGLDVVREVVIRPDGRISVYPVGDVVAAGLNPVELQLVLVDLLSAELRQPRVTVEVAKLAGNKVHVLGRVKRPGSYEAGPFMTLTQAIAESGGFEDDAARNSIVVFRRDGAKTVKVARVRLDKDIKSGSLLADLPLSRFDIVYVPRSSIGNLTVFTSQFFGPVFAVMNTGLLGWELFNLDRVFVARTVVN